MREINSLLGQPDQPTESTTTDYSGSVTTDNGCENGSSSCGGGTQKDLDALENELKADPLAGNVDIDLSEITDDEELPSTDSVFDNNLDDEFSADDEDDLS
jgi:hypothetical protein